MVVADALRACLAREKVTGEAFDPTPLRSWVSNPTDPFAFVLEVFKAEPYPWQVKVLSDIRDRVAAGDPVRVAIKAGHGVGKTTLLAWIIIWFVLTRQNVKIPVAANSEDQLRDTIWSELALWIGRLPGALKGLIAITSERVFLKSDPNTHFVAARVANKARPEALQGYHADFLLFIIDEASGIPDEVFEVATSALSTPGAITIMAGNPTRPSGYFYDTFHSAREGWLLYTVSSESVPKARGHIKDIITRYGKDSNAYRIRVLGEFPDVADEQVITMGWIEAAIARDVAMPTVQPIWGVDVARFGSDRSALVKRRGTHILEPAKWWSNRDVMQTAGLIKAEYDDTPPGLRPYAIMVDVIGVGAGVVDRLRELQLPVRGVNVAETRGVSDKFRRLRDELWWKAREWFEARTCKMPDDPHLIADLIAPTYGFTSNGEIVVESKDDMKARKIRSPDLGDAFIMTFAAPDRHQPNNSRWDRAFSRKHRANSWQAA